MEIFMFKTVTPESAGISSKNVLKFLKTLDSYHLSTHSVIMARGENIFAECYYAPFTKDFKHRMYSVSKSFVSIAVGLAAEDGLLSLDDKFVKFFPEYVNEKTDDNIKEMTIRDMLAMSTSEYHHLNWFITGTNDRCEVYFRRGSDKIPGTLYQYDSPASFMLCAIVENLTGKKFLDYLKEKFLNDIGFSKDSYCLNVPGGHSFGDSGVICTARDLLLFARFVMNKGEWNGKRYMNEEYLSEATKKQVSNDYAGLVSYNTYGYGYQIWMAPRGGFAFVGMGDQFAICIPDKDFIFIINSDNQGNGYSRTVLYHSLVNDIIDCLGEPLKEDEKSKKELDGYIKNAKLMHLYENEYGGFANKINGVRYNITKSDMGIEYIKFDFKEDTGTMSYKNAQGEKCLKFGICKNEFSKFPEMGYPNMTAAVSEEGNMYGCAASADWIEEKKLRIKVQIIDKYYGNISMVFSFKDDRISVYMEKHAEAFLNEYNGFAEGRRAGAEPDMPCN